MEALICRASNVVISCGLIRGEAGISGTQEKEKKTKVVDVSRVGEKNSASSSTTATNGRSFSSPSLAPLPFPPQKSLIPAPLRFLWFSNSGKNEEQGSSSGSSGGAKDGKTKELDEKTTDERDFQAENVLAFTGEEEEGEKFADGNPVEKDAPSVDLRDAETETEQDPVIDESIKDLSRLDNGNAAKRWIQNLMSVNFLKKSPRTKVTIPTIEEIEVADDVLHSKSDCANAPMVDSTLEKETKGAAEGGSVAAGVKRAIPECVGCEEELAYSCTFDPAASPLSMLEVAHLNVTHDLESFTKFLQNVPLSELKLIHQSAHLSNLAYNIPQIQAGVLAKVHRLVFVTSSVEIKSKALAEEKAAAAAKGEADKNDSASESKPEFYLSPASAYALAAAAASFLRLEKKKSTENLSKGLGNSSDGSESGNEGSQVISTSSDADILQTLSAEVEVESVKSNISETDQEKDSKLPSLMRPVTSVVSAEKETKQAMAKNLRSLHTSPCEWFAVDEKGGPNRVFSIQGSESFASWQANLLFEPIEFESLQLGVMVHRGIYEAAQGLYDQVLPYVLDHLKTHGERARVRFVGHSLGGSIGMLLSLMLLTRGVLKPVNLLPVYAFGSPYIMCGGDYLLKKLGLPLDHVQCIVMHRDIVPRSTACNYPDSVAEVLRRINGTFRDHSCLARQKLLYAPMGRLMILQPDQGLASYHPLLPSGSGLYVVRHRSHNENNTDDSSAPSRAVEVRAAQRSFLNQPHPLEILSDPGSYGPEGSISKHHDPRNYARAVESVLRSEAKRRRRIERERRRQLHWPLILAQSSKVVESGINLGVPKEQAVSKRVSSQGMLCGPSQKGNLVSDVASGRATFPISVSESCKGRFSRYKSLIASQHVQMGMLLILSARMLFVQTFSVVLAWV
ncbi:hypothetical protein R1sor_002976 [Riccia sorocarpa]|uniref:Fungal lipase-type domain-containing protein n=1 Tax=Riccia sorocarpa TaxID=122646 RepID=A0ABD3H475_9MARC